MPRTTMTPVAQAIKEFLVDQLVARDRRSNRAYLRRLPDSSLFGGWHPMMGRGPMMHGFGAFGMVSAAFAICRSRCRLPDGQWLSFATALPESGPAFSRQFLLSMGIMAIIILAVSVWVVRRVTAPLAALSAAAERLGNDLNAPPMPETGTIETRQASRAFNTMQARLRSLIENRTRMLAAISHDLRTPLTLLRLRAENVENAAERDKMLATIAEMDSMIGATLQFARDEATDRDYGVPPTSRRLSKASSTTWPTPACPSKWSQPNLSSTTAGLTALKRAIRNLIDNAVKYGKTASVAIQTTPKTIEITIDDEGPGIPEKELSRVFEPFYRLEESRSRETGGVGLGLAIALSIVQAHRGEIILSNRPAGGLRASVVLPR